jgi:hypothetical protein
LKEYNPTSKRTFINFCLQTGKNTCPNKKPYHPRGTCSDGYDFNIKLEDENFSGNELTYNLISSVNSAIQVDGSNLPKRDSFGKIITTELEQYCLGSNIINPKKSSQRYFSTYCSLFTSAIQDTQTDITLAVFDIHNGNRLCNFLSIKTILTTEDFFYAFEFLYSKGFPEHQTNTNFNLTRLKRASLNFYDFLGILDYDYETKKIVLSPPKFIFIPTSKGRRILLIGARDSALIDQIINTAPKHYLQVQIINQFASNERLLLPDAISIRAFPQTNDPYGEKSLKAFAEELKIELTTDYFPQVALQDFSVSITEYQNILKEIDENDYDWARYIFNPESLAFDKSETSTFDKSFSFIRYKLNEYTYDFKLWKDNKCYKVDMNWGRFIALKHFNKNVILFDRLKNKVAIPMETPLPRLLSESIMLLSGLAPDFREIDGRYYRVYENIPGIFTQNLFHKLGQEPNKQSL